MRKRFKIKEFQDFLPEDFEAVLEKIRKDSREAYKIEHKLKR